MISNRAIASLHHVGRTNAGAVVLLMPSFTLDHAGPRAKTAGEDNMRAFCRTKLAPYKVPPRVEFRTELPKTMVGKVLRRVLRESVKPPQSL
jgi:acyl-coenzyme A synthetase/AMP-(fatty) acid ligase